MNRQMAAAAGAVGTFFQCGSGLTASPALRKGSKCVIGQTHHDRELPLARFSAEHTADRG